MKEPFRGVRGALDQLAAMGAFSADISKSALREISASLAAGYPCSEDSLNEIEAAVQRKLRQPLGLGRRLAAEVLAAISQRRAQPV